jgi:hypothetical protein
MLYMFMDCQWLATGPWFSLGAVSSTNKTDHHDITAILLKVVINTINPTKNLFILFGTKFYYFPLVKVCYLLPVNDYSRDKWIINILRHLLFIGIKELTNTRFCTSFLHVQMYLKRPCYTVKQVSRFLYHATFCNMILVSLHTKSSSMFHAVCLQIIPAKMENPDNENIIIQIEETLHLLLWSNNITTFFSFPAMFYLPCADHVLLFVDDVVTSWPQTKISDWSEIKCIVTLAVQNRTCSIPKCVSCNF